MKAIETASELSSVRKKGRRSELRLSGVLILVMLFLSGCLTRTAGPTLPYVQPAQSVQQTDPVPVHLAARIDEMEAEMRRLRDMIERAQVGGNDKIVRNLQDRVAFIEKQLGVEAAPSASPHSGPEPRQQPPISSVGPPALARRQEMPPPAPPVEQSGPTGGAVDIRNAPIAPDEKAYRDAYQLFRNGSLDQAIAQFEDFVKKNPKSPLAADAVYWIGEAEFSKGRFDEAVLQFDRVVREFPGSKKELNALLKQAQAFEKMGDAKSARIIYKKLVGDQPHTAQGRIAGTKLKQLPRDE